MQATLERTITLDRDLARRAGRKLRRYGMSMDDAFSGVLSALVSTRGLPPFLSTQDGEDLRDMEFDNVEDAIKYLHKNA